MSDYNWRQPITVRTSHWPRTSRGKLICPDCGARGWPVQYGPSWVDKHEDHEACPDCGKVVPTSSMNYHRGQVH